MAEHNFQTAGPKAYYNTKGAYRFVHSKDELLLAKQDGFLSSSYIRSDWPKMVFNKKTGESKPVGKLEWSDEQNAAAVAACGDNWTTEHVPVPEKVVEPVRAAASTDSGVLLEILSQITAMNKRMGEIEDAQVETANLIAATKATLEHRVTEIEGALEEAMAEPVATAAEPSAKSKK